MKKIRTRIEAHGGRCFKIHGGDNPFQEVGIPDLLCCYHGRFVGLEVKEPGNTPSPVQKVVLHEIVSAGGYASVVSSVEQVELLLAKIEKEVTGVPLSSAGSRVSRINVLKYSIKRHS